MEDITCEGCACVQDQEKSKTCFVTIAILALVIVSFAVGFAVGVVK